MLLSFLRLQIIVQITRSAGKITAKRIPIFKLSLNLLEIIPTKVGPAEQPKSPPRARSANIAVPPLVIAADALLKLPGHIMPTDSPLIAHATRLITEELIKAMHRYEMTQSMPLPIINLSKLILSPYFP